jgi:hypothetical protein
MDPPPESDDDNLDDASVAQLREQIRMLTQARKDDQDMMRQILDRLATLATAQQNPVRSIERDTPSTTASQDQPKCSKKLPDPVPLSNGVDPTFESWKL